MKSFTLLALLLGVGVVPGFADLTNGGFESTNIGQWYKTVFAGDSTTIPGWLVTGNTVDIVNTVNGPDWSNTGNQAIDLAGTPGPGGIEQSIWTNLNERYTFSFYASTNGASIKDGLLVEWNGAPIGSPVTTPSQGTWQQFSYTEQGTGGLTSVSLSTPVTGSAGPLVDDVSVVSAPEPSLLWSLGAGLALALSLIRRSRLGLA